MHYFWLALTVCHQVLSISKHKHEARHARDEELFLHFKEHSKELDEESGSDMEEHEELVYHGMSPDEVTIVNIAKDIGYEFRYKTNQVIEIKLNGQKKRFNLVH